MKTTVDAAKAKFIGLFITSLVMCVVVTAAFWGPLPRTASETENSPGMAASRETGPTFSGHVMNDAGGPDSVTITGAEKSLGASLDSLHGGSGAGAAQVATTLALFREAIRDPRSVSLLSDALHNKNKPQPDALPGENEKLKDSILVKEGQLVSLQNELKTLQNSTASPQPEMVKMRKSLDDKEAQINSLQNQLKTLPKASPSDAQALARMKEDLNARDAQIARLNTQIKSRPAGNVPPNVSAENKKLSDENNFLKWAVRSEVNSNHNLTNLNKTLKEANASLQSQINDLKKK